jgi:hypothetical protein
VRAASAALYRLRGGSGEGDDQGDGAPAVQYQVGDRVQARSPPLALAYSEAYAGAAGGARPRHAGHGNHQHGGKVGAGDCARACARV